jgi:hypothetical protein
VGCHSPLKGWKDRDTGGITFRRENGFGEKMEVGCGQCLGCRLDHSRMWAMRIIHESAMYEHSGGNAFVTLTYRDKADCSLEQCEKGLYIPDDWSLHKDHFQKFMKRLRKAFPDNLIRFFAAGEYGRRCKHGIDLSLVKCPLCNTGRPHFHACLFNCNFTDLEPYESDGGIVRYTSKKLERIWGYGFVDVGELTYASANYTAKYILKKVRAVQSDHHYMTYDMDGEVTFISPEFVLMSRGKTCKLHRGMPYQVNCPNCSRGLGRDWYERYKSDVYPSDEVPIPGAGVMKGVPRYYDNALREENPEMYECIKDTRKEFMREHADDYTDKRLLDKHKVAKARIKMREERKLA